MRAVDSYRPDSEQASTRRVRAYDGLGLHTLAVGALAAFALLSLATSAAAQPTADDDEIRPPPGTPGSTVEDEPIRPPPGTPGSTAAGASTGASTSAGAGTGKATNQTGELPRSEGDEDKYSLRISSRTYVRMFKRRYLVGFLDAGPEDETLVPIYEYASLRADRLDAPWGEDSIDVRLSAWGLADTVDVSQERRLTGDLMDANVTSRFGPVSVTLGRQLASGGPALVTRFDGVSAGVFHDAGLGIEGYGGLSVRPRFRSRREYVLLGSATESLLRQPDALPDTSATDGWMAGGRVSYRSTDTFDVGAAFHERHERGQLDRRWASADARVIASKDIVVGGLGTVDADGGHIVEARGFADLVPLEALTTTLDVLHTSPALFLSRGSVLSVFSLDTVTEAGGELTLRATPDFTLGASGHHQWFSDSGTGYRVSGRARARFGGGDRVVTQLRYSRVGEDDLGYHAVRGSVSLRVARPWTATTAVQQYFYDQAIRGVESSTYGSATLEYGWNDQPWRIMVGGFITRSPYALVEAEGLARLSFDLDHSNAGRRP